MNNAGVYKRKVREHGGSIEIVIPKPLFRELKLGKLQTVFIWLSQNLSIEISNAEKTAHHVNGIVLRTRIYLHTNSYALRLPEFVASTLKGCLKRELDDVEIFKNDNGNIEFKPIFD